MLEQQEYLNKIDDLHSAYAKRVTVSCTDARAVDQNEVNSAQYASANLRHLLPELPISRHDEVINEVLFTQVRAALDEDSCFLFEHLKIVDSGAALETAKSSPLIFCTFHFGSYRLINQVLVSRGLNYVLPVNTEIYGTQKQRYEDGLKVLQAFFKTESQLMVVNAEQPTAALTLARKTRAGWSLLAYIDGNTGVQGAGRRDSKTIRIPLLDEPIFARKGIAFLSHFLKVPIVPVICEITGKLERVMTFHDMIDPSGFTDGREAYCRMATEKLYAVLGDYLKRIPGQWEGWLDAQKYLDTDGLTEYENIQDAETDQLQNDLTGRKLMFNHDRYGFIIVEDQRALLDKSNYKLLSLPDSITAILNAYGEPTTVPIIDTGDEGMDTITQLVSMGILVPSQSALIDDVTV